VALVVTLLLARLDRAPGGRSAEVVALTESLPAGTVVAPADVTLRSVPAVMPGDLVDPSQVVGQVTTVPLAAGEVVRSEDVADPATLGLPYQLAPGERALTLGLSPVEAVGYQLQSGDRVDAFVTITGGGLAKAPFTKVVEEDLRVLSVSPPGSGAAGGEVTLAVTPTQAATLLLGQTLGTVTLVLRRAGDRHLLPVTVNAGALAP
jgi:pilus assembly protein CpaB